jgi:hypothetical protein
MSNPKLSVTRGQLRVWPKLIIQSDLLDKLRARY